MSIRNELIIGLAGVIMVLVATLFLGQQYQTRTSAALSLNNTTNSNNKSFSGDVFLTEEEVAKHSVIQDCWMIISGKVYSVGSYALTHPGGEQAIASFCGKDGTVAFNTKGGGQGHSQNAVSILASYFVGDLGSKASVSAIQAVEKQAQALPILRNQEDDD